MRKVWSTTLFKWQKCKIMEGAKLNIEKWFWYFELVYYCSQLEHLWTDFQFCLALTFHSSFVDIFIKSNYQFLSTSADLHS